MVKKHLKTLTVPKSWPIKRKGRKFVIRPLPGKSFSHSMPLALIFKDILKYSKTTKEVKTILLDKKILVDGKRRYHVKYLLGFMDVLSIPISKEYYRVLINQNKKLQLLKIDKAESSLKVTKITGKTKLRKGLTQLNLFDGRTIVVKKDNYTVGDSLLLEIPLQKIKEHFKLEKGKYVFIYKGKHTAEHGSITDVKGSKVSIKAKQHSFDTDKEFVYVIGKDKPVVKIK